MPVAFGYVRVSHSKPGMTDREVQKELDISIRNQVDRVVAYHELYLRDRAELYPEVFIDVQVSARFVPFSHRPEGGRLDDMAADGDHIIFAHLDRAFRFVRDYAVLMEDWEERHITVHFADLGIDVSTPQGKLIANLMASMAQAQSDFASERLREMKAYLRSTGRPEGGRRRIGYWLKKGRYVPYMLEWQIMMEIVRLRDQEHWSWERISDHIEEILAGHEQRPVQSAVFRPRRLWRWPRCKRAYRIWKEVILPSQGPEYLQRVQEADGNGSSQ